MRTTKFSFFLFFFFSFFLIEQAMAQEFRCGTPPATESQRAEIIRKLRLIENNRTSACSDPINNSVKTYKVVFEYAIKSNGERYVSPTEFTAIETYINSKYSQYQINFIFSYFPILCDNCDNVDAAGWGSLNPTNNTNTNFPDCIYGRIAPFNNNGVSGLGSPTTGRFFASKIESLIAHELGHALGLLHTHDGFNPGNPEKNENIIQNEESGCLCNCSTTADFICDTPVDPFINQREYPEIYALFPLWNANMLDQFDKIENLDNEVDFCGNLYSNTLIPLNTNLMSYNGQASGIQSLEAGQGAFIKGWNAGKPWEINGTTPPAFSPTMDAGFAVDRPMLITSQLNLTGDIIVNNILTIQNTTLGFMKNKGIIINSGGKLIVDNSYLIPYEGYECVPQSTSWRGIFTENTSLVQCTIKNNSVLDRATIGIQGKNCNMITEISSNSRINSYNSTAIELLNNRGIFKISNSYLNGKILCNNSFSGIQMSSSVVNAPTSSKIDIKNSGFFVNNKSTINTTLEIDNLGSQSIRLNNSTFNRPVEFKRSNGKAVVRENTFNSETNTYFNTKDLDLYDNNYNGADGPVILGNERIKTLAFKNRLNSSRYGIQNANFLSNTKIECNNFLFKGTNDLFLREPIALSQGSSTLAAGNSFSRTLNLEVNYLGGMYAPEIKYHFHPQGTEEPSRITPDANFTKVQLNPQETSSACKLNYPNTTPIPKHCINGRKDGDETGIDCGGSCPPCIQIVIPSLLGHCTNGILDQGETTTDCGGTCPPCTCSDGIRNNGETDIDCGGPNCPPCTNNSPTSCTDGVQNGNETGVDCGGPTCPPCDTQYCNDGIQNNGETGIDCGGPCPACILPPPSHCSNGVQDSNESGIDCGGACPACPPPSHCTNGVQDGNEAGIDCGGSCPPCIIYYSNCYNGIQDGNETGIDCGGSCPPCVVFYPPHCYNGQKDGSETGIDCGGSCPPCGNNSGGGNEGGASGSNLNKYEIGDHSAFIQSLTEIYGTAYFTTDRYKVIEDFAAHQTTLDGGNSCAAQQYIMNNSESQSHKVIEYLTLLSPNVSANTMHILFAHSQYFISAQVANLIALNPAVLSDRYIAYIVYKTSTFNTGEKSQIIQAAIPSSTRRNTEAMLSFKEQYQNAIIRDNIAMLSLNTSIDFNAIRSEIATDPDPLNVFEIAQTYADQSRYDLATEALTQADLCKITDPFYRAQLNGLVSIYSNWEDIQSLNDASRNDLIHPLLIAEHGIATDIASNISNQAVMIKERWKYDPLTFLTQTSVNDLSSMNVDIYPNPAYDVLNINIKGKITGNDLVVSIINADGKVIAETGIKKDINNIDISALNSGIYTVKIMQQNQTIFVSKFIKIQ